MITVLFFIVLFGIIGAVIIGTLGDEIHGLITRFIDHLHADEAHKKMKDLYHEAVKRS
jgi:hypothetical protein